MMRMLRNGIVVGIALAALAGCRTAAHVVEEPRVDLEVTEGFNRGYLLGTPPEAQAPSKTTRKMMETVVEVPPMKGMNQSQSVSLTEVAPPEVDMSEELAESGEMIAGPYASYMVKKGDTLWSIAADPKVLGDGTKWRAIYHINRETLKTPDRLRPGMTLKIPQSGATVQASSEPAPAADEGKTVYTK